MNDTRKYDIYIQDKIDLRKSEFLELLKKFNTNQLLNAMEDSVAAIVGGMQGDVYKTREWDRFIVDAVRNELTNRISQKDNS